MEIPTLDLAGVVCPMTWMRARMRLGQMSAGESLVVVVDEGKPALEFPRSAKAEGHRVKSVERRDGKVHFTVECRGLAGAKETP